MLTFLPPQRSINPRKFCVNMNVCQFQHVIYLWTKIYGDPPRSMFPLCPCNAPSLPHVVVHLFNLKRLLPLCAPTLVSARPCSNLLLCIDPWGMVRCTGSATMCAGPSIHSTFMTVYILAGLPLYNRRQPNSDDRMSRFALAPTFHMSDGKGQYSSTKTSLWIWPSTAGIGRIRTSKNMIARQQPTASSCAFCFK